jgi:hypothetical protein
MAACRSRYAFLLVIFAVHSSIARAVHVAVRLLQFRSVITAQDHSLNHHRRGLCSNLRGLDVAWKERLIKFNTTPIAQAIRTRSRHYVTYSLLAFARAATFAKNAGEDVLIKYEGPQNQSLKHGTLSKPMEPNQSN